MVSSCTPRRSIRLLPARPGTGIKAGRFVRPVLELDLRLGEGSGAVLALPLVKGSPGDQAKQAVGDVGSRRAEQLRVG